MEVTIAFLLWAILSIFMLGVIDLASFKLKRLGWRRFISSFLLFYTQIIVSEFFLGVFSILNGRNLVLINLIFSVGLLYGIVRKSSSRVVDSYLASLKRSLSKLWNTIRSDPLLMVLAILVIIFLVWVIFLGVIFPATDFDGNSYHLTFIGYVMQNHTFFDAPTSLKWLAGYPKGGEFIQMWSVIIPGRDIFSDLAQLPFLGMGVYALFEIGQSLGVNKRNARFAALLFIFLPIVLNQLKTTYVDVMLCTLFFASLSMVIQKKLNNLDLLLLGIIFSLILSIKSTGLLFVAAAVPLLLFNLYQNRSREKGTFVPSYVMPLMFVAIPMIFGLYWYIKNWVVYGSPIYPFGFKLLGAHIFPGQTFQEFAANAVGGLKDLPKGCANRIWFVWTEQKDWFGCFYNYDTNYTGLGPIWFVLLIPAVLTAGYSALKEKRYKLIAVAATIVGLFAIYPTNYYSRYTMFVTAIGIIGLGVVLDKLSGNYQKAIKVIAIVLAVSVIATNFVLCNFPPRVVKDQILHLGDNSARGPAYNGNPGLAFVYIESHIKPSELVVYDSSPFFIYPLWRPDFSNKVAYLPSKDKEDWLRQVRANHTRYVFTTIWSKERPWAEASLPQVYKDEIYEIYQAN